MDQYIRDVSSRGVALIDLKVPQIEPLLVWIVKLVKIFDNQPPIITLI